MLRKSDDVESIWRAVRDLEIIKQMKEKTQNVEDSVTACIGVTN